MRHYIGLLATPASPTEQPGAKVFFEPSSLITGHALLVGQSGTGKTTESKRILSSAVDAGLEVDAFDVHDELDDIPGAAPVMFSQHTRYGRNPLALNQDVHTGGPARQTDMLVKLIRQVSPWLGVRQESVLRYLCADTYAIHGIQQDNPETWHRRNATERDRIRLINSGTFRQSRQYFPTLEDLRDFARTKIAALAIGGDNPTIEAYQDLKTALTRLHRLTISSERSDTDVAQLETKVADAKRKYRDAHEAWFDTLQTGRELDDVLKYRNLEELQGVVVRLDLLNSTGIFRANPPPFGTARLRVHQIKSLTTEQQVLYTKLEVQRAFEDCKLLGPIAEGHPLRRIVFLEEAHKFFTKEPDDIINVVSKEARKFGLALICSSQQPTHFPRDFLTNCGATIITGLHNSYWRPSEGLLGIDQTILDRIRPREIIAVKLQRARQSNAAFALVTVPNHATFSGRRAASAISR